MKIKNQTPNSPYLFSYLKTNRILSKEKLLSAIDHGMPDYDCYSWNELKKIIDVDTEESRVFERDVELRKVIITDAPNNLIRFTNCNSVKLIDCIFFCNVNFSLDRMNCDGGVECVHLDHCLIFGDLTFTGTYPGLELGWVGISCYKLSFFNIEIKSIRISQSNIFHLSGYGLAVSDEFAIINNNIKLLEFYPCIECSFTDFNNHYNPRDLPVIKHEHKEAKNRYSLMKKRFDLFNFSDYDYESEKTFSLYETYCTLRNSNDNSKSIGFNANLDYFFYLHYPRLNLLQKGFIYLTQAFLNPLLFFLYSALMVSLSSCLFYNYLFNEQTYKTFFEAMYLSVITFTTTGYGDIVPTGYMRGVACFESISGIILVSCFTVALVRKYFGDK